jgi:hypothetical protein
MYFSIATLLIWIRLFLYSPLLVRGEYTENLGAPLVEQNHWTLSWHIAYQYAKWGYI